MAGQCPYCGASISYVGDAYCSECRGPLTEDMDQRNAAAFEQPSNTATNLSDSRSVEHILSFPARLVILLSVVAATAGTAAYVCWIYTDLPPGRYPLWFFAMPVVMAVGLLCAAGLALLRFCGIPIYQKIASENRNEPSENK